MLTFRLGKKGDFMKVRNVFSTTFPALLSLTLVAACGGGAPDTGTPDEGPDQDVEQADAGDADAMEMLGGGHASPVHDGTGGSPHVSVHWNVNEGNITIDYGRPLPERARRRRERRAVARRGLETGRGRGDHADHRPRSDARGNARPAGEYTLWTAHMNDEFHLIVNSETGQWGTAYNAEHDVAHIPMEVGAADPPAEQLVISIDDSTLGFEWGALTASVPLMVH